MGGDGSGGGGPTSLAARRVQKQRARRAKNAVEKKPAHRTSLAALIPSDVDGGGERERRHDEGPHEGVKGTNSQQRRPRQSRGQSTGALKRPPDNDGGHLLDGGGGDGELTLVSGRQLISAGQSTTVTTASTPAAGRSKRAKVRQQPNGARAVGAGELHPVAHSANHDNDDEGADIGDDNDDGVETVERTVNTGRFNQALNPRP